MDRNSRLWFDPMIEERSRNYFERDIQRDDDGPSLEIFYLRPLENDIYGYASGMEQERERIGWRGGR